MTNIVQYNPALRKKATLHIYRRKSEVVNEGLLYQLIDEAISHKKEREDIFDCLKKIDLTKCMIDSQGLNQRFTCSFFANRNSWISKGENGHYRYFSQGRNGVGLYAFDIFDLLGIFRNETSKQVLTFIRTEWNLTGLTDWHTCQYEKYVLNDLLISQYKMSGIEVLDKVVAGHWDILQAINSYARDKVSGQYLSQEGESLFFLSTHYLKEHHFPQHSVSTINQCINLFCLLGFLKKISHLEIPKNLAIKADVEKKRLHHKNAISFYILPDISTVTGIAIERATQLIQAKIPYYRLTKDVVLDLFGKEMCQQIYIQHTVGRRSKKDPMYFEEQSVITEKERLERHFLRFIEQSGKCEKTELKNMSLLPNYRFNRLWKEFVQKHNCKEKTPTNTDMIRYNMKKRHLMAVPGGESGDEKTIEYSIAS